MAISDTQKIDLLFKKLAYGVTKTDTNDQKAATNEAIASPLLNRSDKLWSQSGSIPGTAPGSSTSILDYYNVLELEADITASTNRTWLTNRSDWVPPEFGSTYQVKIYMHTADDSDNAVSGGTQLFAAGSGNNDEWYFDYQAGVLNFIGSNLPSGISGKSIYIVGYQYTGNFGLAGGSAGFDSDQVIAIINENSVLTDSDLKAIADLRNDVDSDTIKIQNLQELVNALRADADSDSIAIQALSIKSNVLAARLDSDEAAISKLRADIDSDSVQIQQLRTDVEDSDFIINKTPFRLDDSTFATTSSNQVLDTFDRNEHKTVKYIVSAKKDSDWQSSEVLVNHDGSTAYAMEYAIMDSGAGDLFIADADVSGETVRLLITPQTTNISVSIIRTQVD